MGGWGECLLLPHLNHATTVANPCFNLDSIQVITDAVSSVGAPVSMDKMVYLSERMFFQEGTTDAGYLDQCARLRNQLGGMTQVQQYVCVCAHVTRTAIYHIIPQSSP